MNAGNPGSGQQLREASFARRRSQWHAVQQNLRSGGAQQQAAPAAVIQRVAQLFPCSLKLLRRFGVSEFVQTRKFQQNIQAADERPRPATSYLGTHGLLGGCPPHASSTLVSPTKRHKLSAASCSLLNNILLTFPPHRVNALHARRLGEAGGKQIPHRRSQKKRDRVRDDRYAAAGSVAKDPLYVRTGGKAGASSRTPKPLSLKTRGQSGDMKSPLRERPLGYYRSGRRR